MDGDGTKLLVMIFCIHACLYIGQSTINMGVSQAESAAFMNTYGHTNVYNTTNMTIVEYNGQNMSDAGISAGGGVTSGVVNFWNSLAPVWGVLEFIWGILTAPIGLFTLPIHWIIKLLIFGPLMLAYFMAVVAFVRGGSF